MPPGTAASRPERRQSLPGSSKSLSGPPRPAISSAVCGRWRSAVMRARENRLTGLEIDAKRTDSAADHQRIRLQATAKVHAAIRAGLVQSGISPAYAKALHHGEAEAAELASLGEKSGLPGDGEQFEASGGGGLADVF